MGYKYRIRFFSGVKNGPNALATGAPDPAEGAYSTPQDNLTGQSVTGGKGKGEGKRKRRKGR